MDATTALSIYRELYAQELQRKDAINASLSIPISVVALLIAGVLLFAKDFPEPKPLELFVVFAGLYSLATLCLLVAGGLYLRAWWKHEYGYVAAPSVLEKYRVDLQAYHSTKNTIADFEPKFIKHLIEIYCGAATKSRNSNKRKARFAFLGTCWLVVALFLLLGSTLAFVFLGGFDQPQKIEIVASKPLKE
jgi:hypothetical protein